MSRCKLTNLPFEETDDWQCYCSVTCAMLDICGRVVTEADKNRNNKVWRKWDAWISDPKNRRTVRMGGEVCKPPKFGRFVKRTVDASRHGDGKKPKWVTIDVNVGGEIVVSPYSDRDREYARKMRGRGMGVDPSTVIYSLGPGFGASVTEDIDGGMGVIDYERGE